MVDFTVAVRTYNGAKRLPALIDRLRSQVDTDNISWEIVIIDNNSTDNTATLIQDYQSNWSQAYPLHYYFEPKQGASIARKRAIQEAQASLIGFLDDDNLPELNWVVAAYSFGQSHPQAGAYGGQIHGEFEREPPENFSKIAVYFAIIERGKKAFNYNNHKQKVLPPGAGLVIRKQAWLESVPDDLLLSGPQGRSISAKGEDMEILSYLQNAGWEIWYNPDMHIYHTIPAWRIEREYLILLVGSSGLTRHHIRMIRLKSWQRPLAFFAYLANDFRKLITYYLKNYKVLNTDIIVACEMKLLATILISPFYMWRIEWLKLIDFENPGINN
ncbi:MAG: hormogonium polysaccharide biosynthesis glycosyltransferase HpsE [Coleofasciculus sp. G3-WIS-01]|uniref:hormogonium polysaccharide biosynthesis glycosyltransferase HpsE n=1 Tax=Coleofasciculus sp. G3-WIS-01 TaxID=3069528 RepID=UPI0032F9C5DF